MKARIFTLAILLLFLVAVPLTTAAQKYASVNTDYILGKLPDYDNAVKRLDRYVEDWKKEIEEKAAEIETLRAEYEQESYLLPENLKKRRRDDIAQKEQEIRDLQKQRFGEGGDLDRKRSELLRPIQDRVYSMIERIAHEKNYAFVFDRSGNNAILFVNKKYDISDDVLELLGYHPDRAPAPEKATDEAATKASKRRNVENPEMRSLPSSKVPNDPLKGKPTVERAPKEFKR
ncbi:MAG: OmpH family outer membrane protein [Bacteroidales bacterium]|nr:OmpH family outer membrane protein [Bacteroidales bacterium]